MHLFSLNKKKVLIVEDDTMLRATLRDKFEEKKFRVLESGDPHEVLSIVGAEVPDAIVLDLILPVQDGISLLEELRTSGCTVPVVILSNLMGSADLRGDAARLDASFYNKSSTSLDEIVAAVEKKL